MPRNKVLSINDQFIAKAKIADTDELAETAIKDALSKGGRLSNLEDAIATSLSDGQDLKRPLGQEAASVTNTPESQNLFRVFRILQRHK